MVIYFIINIFNITFRQNLVELDAFVLEKYDTRSSNFQLDSAAFFDLSAVVYFHNFSKCTVLDLLRTIDALAQKRKIPIFAFLRNSMLCNEYFYLIHKAIIITSTESKVASEERFTEPSDIFPVSILSKSGSSKLEIDDRFEFSISNGFVLKKFETIKFSGSDFDSDCKNVGNLGNNTEARILVEDSDRDSEDEMEADSNF